MNHIIALVFGLLVFGRHRALAGVRARQSGRDEQQQPVRTSRQAAPVPSTELTSTASLTPWAAKSCTALTSASLEPGRRPGGVPAVGDEPQRRRGRGESESGRSAGGSLTRTC